MQFYIWPGTVFTSNLCKRIQKLIEKQDARVRSKTQLIVSSKQFHGQLLQKKQLCHNSYKRLGPEESQKSYWSQCIQIILQLSLQSNNPQKQLTTSKTFETKICKAVDGVRKFTVKSMRNFYKRFRIKKARFPVPDVSKSYVITTGHINVAKTE